MRTLGLNHALLTLGLLSVVACPGGGTDDDVGDTGTEGDDGDGDSSDTGEGDVGTTDAETSDAETTGDGDGDTTDAETADSETSDAETSDAETSDADTTDGETTDTETTGDGDGDCSGAAVGICESEPPSDGFTVDMMAIVGDCLELDVSYGGGCAVHTFSSCWDQSFAESDPVQAWLWIDHDAMNDPCDAIVQDTWTIDLSALKQAWQAAYQSQTGTIILHVAGDSIEYDF